MDTSRALRLLSVILLAAWPRALAAQAPADDEALREFGRRATAYVDLHQRLEGPLPTLEISRDLRDVHAAMDALATGIRAARKHARQGDLFTPDVVRVFRRQIAACMPPEEMAALLAEQDEDTPRNLRLRVNAVWPHDAPFSYVPPPMLAVLPPLPPELQYRIIGRSLVLWDPHANLIVDYIPEAFAT